MKTYKLQLLCILLFFSALHGLAQNNRFSLKGTVVNSPAKKVYLQQYDNKMLKTIDSADVVNGGFVFKTKPKLPELYGITLDPEVDLLYPFYIFLENAPVTVTVDSIENYKNSSVIGSSQQDLFNAYKKSSRNFNLDSFIRANSKSLVPAYVLYRNYSFRLTPEEIEKYTALFDPSLANTQYIRLLKSLPATLRESGVGKKAINFEQWDTEGRSYKLYDHLGKYLFIDFWAAWCPPCRAELPGLVKLYDKYKGDGWEVLGVSFDKSKAAWLKAIDIEQLSWKQVSDLKYWDNNVGKLYGIRLIPANVLLDPEGKIVARNLHGEELEKKLEDIFKH